MYVCLRGVTWSVKGSQGPIGRTLVVEPAAPRESEGGDLMCEVELCPLLMARV